MGMNMNILPNLYENENHNTWLYKMGIPIFLVSSRAS